MAHGPNIPLLGARLKVETIMEYCGENTVKGWNLPGFKTNTTIEAPN
jgi:hypothetical protein